MLRKLCILWLVVFSLAAPADDREEDCARQLAGEPMGFSLNGLWEWIFGPPPPPQSPARPPAESLPPLPPPAVAVDSPARAELKRLLAGNDLAAQDARDFVVFRWLQSRSKSHTLSLLLGNPHEAPSAEAMADVQVLVRQLAADGYRVLYDADSRLGPTIAAAGGPSALGISGRGEARDGIIPLVNPYLRLLALGTMFSENVIASPDSVTGQGVLLEHNGGVVWDRTGTASRALEAWNVGVRRLKDPWGTFGIRTTRTIPQTKQMAGVYVYGIPTEKTFPRYEEAATVAQLTESRLTMILALVRELANGRAALEADAPSGGVVVFGSSSEKHAGTYGKLVSELGAYLGGLGIPGTSGGAGGLMRVVNRAFFETGARSAGIPLQASFLWQEKEIPREVHTVTYMTGSYEARIPLLLHRRGLLLFVPGRSGTVRELAAVLVQAAALGEAAPPIVFADGAFYRELVDILSAVGIPEAARRHWYVVDGARDLATVVEPIQESLLHTPPLR